MSHAMTRPLSMQSSSGSGQLQAITAAAREVGEQMSAHAYASLFMAAALGATAGWLLTSRPRKRPESQQWQRTPKRRESRRYPPPQGWATDEEIAADALNP